MLFKTLTPEMKIYRNFTGKNVTVPLLVDNTPSHTSVECLDGIDELVTIKSLPPDITSIVQLLG
ncbi:hypothetical protein M514_10685 [Trichuris suis]|uniref:DDE-1 domain-containing protein n=1 Tax=Trichuris suis TaxID=68888 RepID=A0A085MY39_9BILA|nr:hypothetical protein M513_10685 [Trichuris suis]KFD62135.1 hypothetical protein M514_10685 [Trichuris suis]